MNCVCFRLQCTEIGLRYEVSCFVSTIVNNAFNAICAALHIFWDNDFDRLSVICIRFTQNCQRWNRLNDNNLTPNSVQLGIEIIEVIMCVSVNVDCRPICLMENEMDAAFWIFCTSAYAHTHTHTQIYPIEVDLFQLNW